MDAPLTLARDVVYGITYQSPHTPRPDPGPERDRGDPVSAGRQGQSSELPAECRLELP